MYDLYEVLIEFFILDFVGHTIKYLNLRKWPKSNAPFKPNEKILTISNTNLFQVGHPSDQNSRSNSNARRYQRRHHRHHKNKTVTTADVLTTSASVEALLLSPTTQPPHRIEAASSPMSPLTGLTSVEINSSSQLDLNLDLDSPSRFSSNSINTVILNPNIVQNNHASEVQT